MQIAELRFGDVGRGLSRYRPVALAVGAIVVMGLVLEGPERVAGNDFGASGWSTPAAAAGAPSQVPEASVSDEAAAAFAAIESSPSSVSSSFASPASSFSSSAGTSSSFTSDAFVTRPSGSDDSSSSATFDSSAPPSTSSTSTSAVARPLRVTEAAWASAQAGTPLAATGVPEGALPIGRRPGFDLDKASFVRLSGGATVLRLVPHEDAAGHRNGETAGIQACRLTSADWQKAEAQSFDEAPKWDCGVSVLGVRAEDGSWTFDLSVFPNRADDQGFALLPAGSAIDFQVAFTLG